MLSNLNFSGEDFGAGLAPMERASNIQTWLAESTKVQVVASKDTCFVLPNLLERRVLSRKDVFRAFPQRNLTVYTNNQLLI